MRKKWSAGVMVCLAMIVAGAHAAHAQDVVITANNVTSMRGNWSKASSTSAAGGQYIGSTDNGASAVAAPLASPQNYFEASFTAPSYTTYHVWMRLRASGDSKWNDSVWVQFSDASTPGGSAAYRINSSNGLLVNLEACSNCGVSSWGWQDGAYWLSQNSLVMFGASGSHTIRVQTREDGAQIDQIVLSPVKYLASAPGAKSNDTTIVSASSSGSSGSSSASGGTPFSGSPISLPGTIGAGDFNNGGEGVAYHDTSSGNTGGAYRATDVDLQTSSGGGTNIGWIAAGEWLNYSVNVASSGTYTVQLKVASPSGGALHVGFNGSGAWNGVSVPATGSWQSWTAVSTTMSLSSGTQLLTLAFDTNGFNVGEISVSSGSGSSESGSSSSSGSGTVSAIPGTIEAEDFDSGGEGVAYHDTTGGNAGGQYRSGNVDIERATENNYDIGWTAAGEWLNYTVNVASGGAYTVNLRVSSMNGGTVHVGFNGSSAVWSAVTVPPTGAWQAWTTVKVPATLAAGKQIMTVLFDTGGVNLNYIQVSAGSTSTSTSSGSGGTSSTSTRLRFMTWNIQHGTTRSGSYDPVAQAKFIVSQNPDVVALQEVETWNENQPERFRTLLQDLTGQAWTLVWAPVINTSATEGNVILTRLPVISTNTYRIHANGDWSAMYSNRSVAQATVRVNGVNVNVFSTHLDYYSTSDRTIQLEQLLSWSANFAGPRLLAGDFNSWWGEYWITHTMETHSDTWQDVTGSNQDGYTVNNAVRFDYIFRSFSGGSRAIPTNCYVPSTSLSDHYPVIADFTVK